MTGMKETGLRTSFILAAWIALGSMAASSTSQLPPRPIEILKMKSTWGPQSRVVDTDTKRVWVDWDGFTKNVFVYRSSRADSTETWSETEVQQESTSFTITDVVAMCGTDPERLQCLYVSGFHWGIPAQSTIEKWTFAASSGLNANDPPSISKSVIYLGSLSGVVSNIAVDRQERRAFVLTWEDNELYEIALPGGSPTSIASQTTVPELAHQRSIFYRRHVTEGPKYMLSSMGGNNHSIRVYSDARTILLSDTNDDGTIDTVEYLTDQAWQSRGYDDPNVWIEGPCD